MNKFFDTEGRINCLLEILQTMEVEVAQLDEKSAKFWKENIAFDKATITDATPET